MNPQVGFSSEGQDKARLVQAAKTAATAYEKAKAEMASVAEQVFELYSMLIAEKARQPWTKLVQEQVEAAPWTDLQGVEHAEQHTKSWNSFLECVRFHLLTVFCNDATETERYYIRNCLKKPNRLPMWQFVQQVQQLKSYLEFLPCLYHSLLATKLTMKLGPFGDKDLVSHILCMCPGTWQAQYELTKDTVPQSMHKLLEALKCIEKAFPMDKEKDKKGRTNQGDSNKRKIVFFLERIPEKKRTETKQCVLCKTHWDVHSTHNTRDCCKYEKDGTPKKTFGRNQPHGISSEKRHAQSYAQLLDKLAKLKKAHKRLKTTSSHKRKWYDRDRNDSNLSWSVGSDSTGILNVKDNKPRNC